MCCFKESYSHVLHICKNLYTSNKCTREKKFRLHIKSPVFLVVIYGVLYILIYIYAHCSLLCSFCDHSGSIFVPSWSSVCCVTVLSHCGDVTELYKFKFAQGSGGRGVDYAMGRLGTVS